FLSEELWQNITPRTTENALVITQQSKGGEFGKDVLNNFEFAKEMISGVRNYRQSKGISPRETAEIFTNAQYFENEDLVKKLANISDIHYAQKTDKPSFTFLIGSS